MGKNLWPAVGGLWLILAVLEALAVRCPFILPWPVRYQLALPAGYDEELGVVQPPGLDVTLRGPEFEYSVATTDLKLGSNVGFRDDGLDSRPIVLALGDSFTWGAGVEAERTWPEVLENLSGVDVVNAGMAGASTWFEARLLERYGPQLGPELVIVGFFPNDIADNLREPGPSMPLRVWLHNHVALYEIGKYGLGALGIGPYAPPPETAFLDVSQAGLKLRLLSRPLLLWKGNPAFERGWQATEQALRQIQRECRAIDSDLLIVAIPTKEQVYWRFLEAGEQYDVSRPNRLLREFGQRAGIPVLDLLPAFRARSDEQLYWSIDGHWNEGGHRLAAQTIHAWLDTHKGASCLSRPLLKRQN